MSSGEAKLEREPPSTEAGGVSFQLVEGASLTLPDGCLVTVRGSMLEVSDGQRLPLPSAGGSVTIQRRTQRPDGRAVLMRHIIRVSEMYPPAQSGETEHAREDPPSVLQEEPSEAMDDQNAGSATPGAGESSEEAPSEHAPSDVVRVGEKDEKSVMDEGSAEMPEEAVAHSVNIAQDEPLGVSTEENGTMVGKTATGNELDREPTGETPEASEDGTESTASSNMGVENTTEMNVGTDYLPPQESDIKTRAVDDAGEEEAASGEVGEERRKAVDGQEVSEYRITSVEPACPVLFGDTDGDSGPSNLEDGIKINLIEGSRVNPERPHSIRHPTRHLAHQDSIHIMKSAPRNDLNGRTRQPVNPVDSDAINEVQARLGPILQKLGYGTARPEQTSSDNADNKEAVCRESPEEPEHVSVSNAIHFFESMSPQRVDSPVMRRDPAGRSSLSPSLTRSSTKLAESCLVSPSRASPRRVNFAARARKVYISSQESDQMEDVLILSPHDDTPAQNIPDPFCTMELPVASVIAKFTEVPFQSTPEAEKDSGVETCPSVNDDTSPSSSIESSSVHALYSMVQFEPPPSSANGHSENEWMKTSSPNAEQYRESDGDDQLVENLEQLISDIEVMETKATINDPIRDGAEWSAQHRQVEEASTASMDEDSSENSDSTRGTMLLETATVPTIANGIDQTENLADPQAKQAEGEVVTSHPFPLTHIPDEDGANRLQLGAEVEKLSDEDEGGSKPSDPFLPQKSGVEEGPKEVSWIAECLEFCCCCWAP